MAAIARNEASSCANPRIVFTHQVDGLLANVNTLSFSIRDLTVDPVVEVIADTPIVLTACTDGGSRVSTGRYVAPFTATAYSLGTHEVVWRYVAAAGGPTRVMRRRFEVVDETIWGEGAAYLGYVDTARAQQLGLAIPTGGTVSDLHYAIDYASRMVETLTGRFFEPRYERLLLTSHGERSLILGHAIIGIEEIGVTGLAATDTQIRTVVDLDLIEVFNRHLRGTLNPDDRDAPRVTYGLQYDPTVLAQVTLRFDRGVLNVDVLGMFGYTDPDGTPVGQTPQLLGRVVLALARRHVLEDPLSEDVGSAAGRVRSVRTRDQATTFMTPRDMGMSASLGSGDPELDTILAQYVRPPHAAVIGPVGRFGAQP